MTCPRPVTRTIQYESLTEVDDKSGEPMRWHHTNLSEEEAAYFLDQEMDGVKKWIELT